MNSSPVSASVGFVGVGASSALSRAGNLGPELLESVKEGARRAVAFLQGAEDRKERVDPVWEVDLKEVIASVDSDIEQEVQAIAQAQAQHVAAEEGPNMTQVNALLSKFEVLPPAPDEAKPAPSGAEEVSSPSPEAGEAASNTASSERQSFSATDFAMLGDDEMSVGIPAELDSLEEGAPAALEAAPAPEITPTPEPAGSPEIDKVLEKEDRASLRDEAKRISADVQAALDRQNSEAPAVKEQGGEAAEVQRSKESPPQVSASVPMSAGASLAHGLAALVGAVGAAPATMVASAVRSYQAAKQQKAVADRAFLRGMTLQSLTTHNVSGMEHSVAELRDAQQALYSDPKTGRVLQEVEEIAGEQKKGIGSIIKEMRPGGKYEFMQGDWEAAIVDNEAYARFEQIGSDIVRRMGRDQPKIGNTSSDLLERYQASVDEAADLTKGIPARRGLDGDMLETLHEKMTSFGDIIRRAMERIKEAIVGRSASNESSGPSPV